MLRSTMASAAFLALTVVSASASTINGSFDGTFASPTGSTSSTFVHTGTGTNTLRWGSPSGAEQSVVEGDSASLTVVGGPFSYSDPVPGNLLLGSITWDNHSNWHAGGSWSSALTLDLEISTPSGNQSSSVTVDFSTYNSTDTTVDTDYNESSGLNPDEISGFVLNSAAFNLPVVVGHGLALTDIFFQLDDAGTPGTAVSFLYNGTPSASQYDATSGFWQNREGGVSTIGIYGTVAAVPLPAGVWLLLSGIAGILAVGRKRRSIV